MNQKPDQPYTAETIRRYLQGEMTEAEMHALEKAALDDPMLADAIEGFQSSISQQGEVKTMQDVEAVNRAFAARFHKTPVRRFPWWQVATAALVIIIAGVVTFNYYSKPPEQLAINPPDTSTQSNPGKELAYRHPDTTQSADAAADLTAKSASASPPHAANGAQQRATTEPVVSKVNTKRTGEQSKVVSIPADSQAMDEVIVSARQQNDSAMVIPQTTSPQARREVFAEDRNQTQNNQVHVISGRVLNSAMEPLANASLVPSIASLQAGNTNNRLNTDRSGYFNVMSPDTSLVVKVSAAGYRDQLFRLRNNPEQNQLVLKQELKGKAAGVEVSKRSAGTVSRSKAQEAEPQGGWLAFDNYIEKNKVYPAEHSNLSGEVIISFQVNNQGRLNNFRILQSLAKGYDEEAVRLIKEGPKWKVLKGRKASVTVTIRY